MAKPARKGKSVPKHVQAKIWAVLREIARIDRASNDNLHDDQGAYVLVEERGCWVRVTPHEQGSEPARQFVEHLLDEQGEKCRLRRVRSDRGVITYHKEVLS